MPEDHARSAPAARAPAAPDSAAPASAGTAPALAMVAVSKAFGGKTVLDAVDFALAPGEVHALLGENGAGKSTLMNILTGIYAADSGRIEIDGAPVAIRGPSDALRLGIGMVHQHFRLVGTFTGLENIRLAAGGREGVPVGAALGERVEAIAAQTGLEAPLGVPVARLSVAERQRIEILKALALGARLLVLDEPTAVLTDDEAERLLALVRRLAADGLPIVLITHKLREVMQAADRVSTLRQGRLVMAARPVAEVDPDGLARAMTGDLAGAPAIRQARPAPGAAILGLAGLHVGGDGRVGVEAVDLAVRAGTIVGIAGVGGNGQQPLAEAIVGLRPVAAGAIRLDGDDLAGASVRARRDRGLRYIPADRAAFALADGLTVKDNLAAGDVGAGRTGRVMVPSGRLARLAAERIAAYAIAGASPERPVRLLSGGNAQKVVLARELDAEARLVIAHSPTRGLDVAACRYVHARLVEAADRGAAVLLISEDLEEIMALADEIHVMSRGRLATTPDGRPDRTAIGAMMLGHA
ncbi:MAG: ABC transporter ATP-binding protein [Azospirillaceae bacterium]